MTRQICTKEKPFDPQNPTDKLLQWQHPDARETDYDSDYTLEYKCPNCGHVFRCEMPD